MKAAATMKIPRSNGQPRNAFRTKLTDLGIPSLWLQRHALRSFVSAPLHLLFLGIVKDLCKLMEEYLKTFKRRASYLRDVEQGMADLIAMQIKFCRLHVFSKTDKTAITSGWLCDNCIAFARIMPALFVGIFFKHINSENLSFNETKHRRAQAMIVSGFVMICLIMSPEQVPRDVLMEHIKTFLSFCKLYSDTIVQSDNERKPFWIGKPNFLTLLTLPEQIEEFGSVHLVNELNYEQEIQTIKPLTVNMRDSDSCRNIKMMKVKQMEVMDMLHDKHQDDVADLNQDWYDFQHDKRGRRF